MRSSCTRDQICAPYIGRQILNHWTTREVLHWSFWFCLPLSYANFPQTTLSVLAVSLMIPKSQDSWVFAKVLILQCASQFRRSPLPYFMFSPPWSSVLRLHPHINCRALPSTWYLGLAAPSRHSPFPFLADPALPWPNSVGTWPYLFACWPGLEVGLGPEMGVCAASKNWDLCIVLSKWKVPALNKEEWPLLLAQDVQGPLEFKTVKCRWHRPTSQSAILPEKNPWLLELWGSFFFLF